ncbi:MAG: transcription-repair coupling factor [Micavibrio aeruginosavorus]|uniref:Transcription-repair-coupling factor n=1 Tax=Micavibrio aeruginosavorus TaxID=349221 RepID=A0A2W5PVS2_9BACT|nr:MAG: transcription-repair coupling factor [Micavibrio aeruginosavorus]
MPSTAPQKMTPAPDQRTIYGAPEGQDARILIDMARAAAKTRNVVMHVATDDLRAAALLELISFFGKDVDVAFFPAWDCLPYDRVSPNPEIVATRAAALTKLLEWKKSDKFLPRILLTTVNAAMQRVTPQEILDRTGFSARSGERISLVQLQDYLVANGYTRTDTVREHGEFAVRGGIVDLFAPGHELPVRIDLFGDEIESIRTFDAATQRTEGKLESFSLRPVTEFFLDDVSIERFRSGYREAFGAVTSGDPLYEAVSEGRRYNGMDHWLPLFFERMNTLFDYAAGAQITFDQHAATAWEERERQISDFYEARKTLAESLKKKGKKKDGDVSLSGAVYHALPPLRLYLGEEEWKIFSGKASTLIPFGAPEGTDAAQEGGARKGRDFGDIRALPDGDLFGALRTHLIALASQKKKILIACYSEGSRERLRGMMEHAAIAPMPEMVILGLEHGFVSADLAILTEQDILGDRLTRRAGRKKKSDNFLTEVSSLNEGDLVVHLDHGIGRFAGLETLKAGGIVHDCLKIIYDGGDKLFVPVENIEVLSRFGSDEGFAQLDKLGGAGWQARKAKVKKDLMVMAEGLLKIAAERQLRKGEKLSVDKDSYDLFTMKFPYQETEDQLKSINDVIADLNGENPMDRLVCGDVGFGKTEVALRAAYVAAMSGTQVAVVVPTTLLSRQHYNNFAARFAGTGLRVEQLSRMVAAKDAKSTRDGLADGSVNIVVGTHAVFAKDTKFSHLGLVIVDEEQRFGVKQKERLKELKADVHVLTLSATPIPRTLQMSLTGVKEMSLITTPPVDRLAIRTFVLPFDPFVVREAIMREHYRGGQTFYVCPRIGDMDDVEKTLKELVPEVKVIAAHGQMSATDLEDRMTAFYEGHYDVLLATNIIESGIDIPRANTMIVHRSDMFGLAQLYQIRGRIGRGKLRAYAYLTYEPTTKLTAQAQKRLEVIETLDTLGAGFQLASHDMDIRGAGNLLGEEQSGHIKEIGVELYQQMLEEAVAAARAGVNFDDIVLEDKWSPVINLGTSVLIPENYVEDLGVRMSLYRRLADLENNADVESFAAELIDRFGKIPDEVENLLDIVRIKQLCRIACVDKVEAGPKGAVIGFYKDSPPNLPKLLVWLNEARGTVKLRADQKLVAVRAWDSVPQRVKGVQTLMKQLADLAA